MYGSTIRRNGGYNENSYTYYPVVIIGAGESGIAMGCRLKEVLGFDQFRVFERQSGIGGTWWINRYPGVACDIPAIFYSFSFSPNHKWTTFHPNGSEIVRYLQGVVQKYGVSDKIQLNTAVKDCQWNESEGIWDITLQHLTPSSGDLSEYDRQKMVEERGQASVYIREEKIKAKVLVSAVGCLVEPKILPDNIPGREKFRGEIFHSARWRYDIDLKDKDVVVVGTGCSAAQFVPRLTTEYGARSVTQIMRSPPWVVPRQEPPMGEKKWEKWSPWLSTYVPGFALFMRTLVATSAEYDWRLFGSSEWSKKEREKMEQKLQAHMEKTVPAKYHEILTPNYGVGCKRRILDASWFPGLNDPKIELTTLPLTSINENSVTLGPGRTYPDPKDTTSKVPNNEVNLPADVIVLANGFEVIKWLHPLEVAGRDGKKLQDVFDERGGPSMYMGTAMDGFPNFFVLFGPNTATGHTSVILASENMVNLALKFIKPILAGDIAQTEVKKQASLDWTKDTQRALQKTVWHQGGCGSWYKTEEGWNSSVYPYSQIWFTLGCMFPTWSHWKSIYTAQGLRKKRAKAALRYLVFTLILTSLYYGKTMGYRIRDFPFLVKSHLKVGLLRGANLLQNIGAKV